jgi:GntR family transcriptional regulator/MocR family aminotransferase
MAIEWSGSRDVHLELPAAGPRRQAVVAAIRQAVRDGRLPPGARLPSTRVLAADLGLARGTVTAAYDELAVQGHLLIRPGSGTVVAGPTGAIGPIPARPPAAKPQRLSLLAGRPDVSRFPRTRWLAAARRAVTGAATADFGYGDPMGHPALRRSLAEYLGRARGVLADPDRIMICGGYAHALATLATVLREHGGPVAVEDPSLPDFRRVIRAAGPEVVGVGVDADGLRVAELPDGLAAVVLTPAHQLPLGGTLSARRRTELVGYARRTGALLVEDDYDGEFRFDRQPVGAVQALDPERVVYSGTTSKTLAPGLRLSWLVLPERLVGPMRAARLATDRHTGVLDQLTLAEFFDSGDYDRQVRRCRTAYRTRRDALLAAVAEHADVTPLGVAAGVHLVLLLGDRTEAAVLAAAARRSLALDGLGRYWLGPGPHPQGVLIGYATPAEHAFGPAVRALIGCFDQESH